MADEMIGRLLDDPNEWRPIHPIEGCQAHRVSATINHEWPRGYSKSVKGCWIGGGAFRHPFYYWSDRIRNPNGGFAPLSKSVTFHL